MGKYNDVKLRILERILKMKKKEMALFVLVWIVLAVAFCLLFSYSSFGFRNGYEIIA